MARPPKKGVDYFAHDSDAINDSKIRLAISQQGLSAYAIYFVILEKIYKAGAPLKVDTELITDLASCTLMSMRDIKRLINSLIKVKLFSPELFKEQKVLFSKRIANHLGTINQKRRANLERQEKLQSENEKLKDSNFNLKRQNTLLEKSQTDEDFLKNLNVNLYK